MQPRGWRGGTRHEKSGEGRTPAGGCGSALDAYLSTPSPPRARPRCPGGAPTTRHGCVARRGDAAAAAATANALRIGDGPPPPTPPSPWATANAATAAPPKQSAARHRAARPQRMSSAVGTDVADNQRGRATPTAAGRRLRAARAPDVVGDRAGGGGRRRRRRSGRRRPPAACRTCRDGVGRRTRPWSWWRTRARRRVVTRYDSLGRRGSGHRQRPVRGTSPHRVKHGRAPAGRPPRASRRGGRLLRRRRM